MAYTICDKYGAPMPIRILTVDAQDKPRLAQEFTPAWWVCDPCNGSNSRYEITFRSDQDKPTGYPWYQIIVSDDTQSDIDMKLAHYSSVIEARKAMEAARREFERLNGGR